MWYQNYLIKYLTIKEEIFCAIKKRKSYYDIY